MEVVNLGPSVPRATSVNPRSGPRNEDTVFMRSSSITGPESYRCVSVPCVDLDLLQPNYCLQGAAASGRRAQRVISEHPNGPRPPTVATLGFQQWWKH